MTLKKEKSREVKEEYGKLSGEKKNSFSGENQYVDIDYVRIMRPSQQDVAPYSKVFSTQSRGLGTTGLRIIAVSEKRHPDEARKCVFCVCFDTSIHGLLFLKPASLPFEGKK